MELQHNRQARRRMISWLGGVAGAIGAVALVATILMVRGHSGDAAGA
jgi:hypothetical protein